jgi:adenylate cyclase
VGREIERKFLLAGDGWRDVVRRRERMRQGYLASNDRVSIRVRIAGERASLNVKSGGLVAVRDEFEYPLPITDAEELLDRLAAAPLVEKTRHWVTFGGLDWEIDEFHGANAGLVVAELELESPDQSFERPPWLGAEVTHLARYYNVNLVEAPYGLWSEAERSPPIDSPVDSN